MSEKLTYEELEKKIQEFEQESLHQTEIEQVLLENTKRYERLVNTIPCALYDYIRLPDGRNRFIYISPQCKKIFELNVDRIIENSDLLWNMVHLEDLERLKQEDFAANQTGELFQSEVRIILSDGRVKWIQLTSMPGTQKVGSQVIWSGVILDITERKQAEEERNILVLELELALAEIKTLKGILPICSFCKIIRDDKGYWNQIESYIHEHSEAEFSHGICQECAKKHYPDLDIYGDE
jgi:PAS domain S-box-containing protein